MTVDLGGVERVDGLMIYSYENVPVKFTIRDDQGTALADVEMVNSPAWAAPIEFVDYLETSELVLEFTDLTTANSAALREIVVLQFIPEPAALTLVGFAGLAAGQRRRR